MKVDIETVVTLTSWAIFIILVALLFFSLKKNKFRLLNGILGNSALLMLAFAVSLTIFESGIQWLEAVLAVIIVLIMVPILLLYLSLGILLLWNAWIVWRRESHSLGNMLTLFLGLVVILAPFFSRFIKANLPAPVTQFLLNTFSFLTLYAVFWLLNFMTSFLITRIFRPKLHQDYIIVLGAGLINGNEVSPLLASRILKAKQFGDLQYQKTGKFPLVIFSGGQGADETLPEGQAMKAYAMAHGMADYPLIAETKSKKTYENMLFSKRLLEQRQLNLQQGIFATSDYHTFRAAGYARFVGLNIDGIGAKTSKFFIPNAFIREYIAILMQHKVFHVIVIALFLIINITVIILQTQFHILT